ncbi:MAG: site-2 protease family protein [Rhodocyclaceae bacterium]|jgi:Zn-dependent protease|nr:site-2 protease family protein [Rhodocyclaceae bacterium]
MNIDIAYLAIAAIPVIFAITLHEAAHGYVARYFGDPTAYQLGRISLNPIRHIDLVGTILVPALTLLFGGILFGWAKPVPVDYSRLRHPRTDMRWVALAGPGINLLMAFGWALLLKLGLSTDNYYSVPLEEMSRIGVSINLMLMALNLLPILPLDGGRVLFSLLPPAAAHSYGRTEPYGLPILLLLLVTGLLGVFVMPLIQAAASLISTVFFI